MPLEKQVVSLELAKKMKELGFGQKSLFLWYYIDGPSTYSGPELGYKGFDLPSETSEAISAYTVAELGEMLSDESASEHLIKAYGQAFNVPDTSFVTIRGVQLAMQNPEIGAKMLIYLRENNLI